MLDFDKPEREKFMSYQRQATWLTTVVICVGCVALGVGGCNLPATPSDTDIAIEHYVQGQLHRERGELGKALVELNRAVQADDTLSVAHEAMGDIHRRRGSNKLAARSYEKACEVNPYAFRPHYNLGVMYQRLAEAAGAFEKAKKYLSDAVAIYLRALTLEPDDYDANLNISACYFQMGKYAQAEFYCKQAIEVQPKSAEAYSNLGTIYDSQNKLYKALNAYKRSLELDNTQPELYLNLGSTCMRQGTKRSFEIAIEHFEKAASLAPEDSSPWELKGLCQFYLREYEKSLEAYNRAIEINRDSAPAYRGIGVAYMSMYLHDQSRKELKDKALDAWQRSLELDNTQPRLQKLFEKYSDPVTGPEL